MCQGKQRVSAPRHGLDQPRDPQIGVPESGRPRSTALGRQRHRPTGVGDLTVWPLCDAVGVDDVKEAQPLSVVVHRQKFDALGSRHLVPGAQDVERIYELGLLTGIVLSKIALVFLDHAFDDIGDAASPRLVRVAP